MYVRDDWAHLFAFQRKYRETHRLTGMQLLYQIGLDSPGRYRRFLDSEAEWPAPCSALRRALRTLEAARAADPDPPRALDLNDRCLDLFYARRDELEARGILDVCARGNTVHVDTDQPMAPEEAAAILGVDAPMSITVWKNEFIS